MSTTIARPPHSQGPPGHEPGSGRRLRYMGRRRIDRSDRNGDPLDGVVNLFDVAIVLAVAFLLAALTGIGLSGALSARNLTIVTNPGQANMQVIVKNGTKTTKLDIKPGQQASGQGTLIGQFYRLPDGTTIYVPSSGAATQTPGTTTPGVAITPTPPGVVITPTASPSPSGGAPGAVTPAPTALPSGTTGQ